MNNAAINKKVADAVVASLQSDEIVTICVETIEESEALMQELARLSAAEGCEFDKQNHCYRGKYPWVWGVRVAITKPAVAAP